MCNDPCSTPVVVPGFERCDPIVYSNCVIWNGPYLNCLELPSGSPPSLTTLIQAIDRLLCSNGTIDYTQFDYKCLASYNIRTAQQFIETVSAIICDLLGEQNPSGPVTSITTIYNYYLTLNNPQILSCYRLLTGISANAKLPELVVSLQQAICNIVSKDEKVKVSANDTQTGYLNQKLTTGAYLKKTILNPGGNEVLKIEIDLQALIQAISTSQDFCDIIDTCNCVNTTWTATGQTRCVNCVSQVQQISNCNQTRWVNSGSACTTSATWVNTSTATRCNGTNLEQEQRDSNPCSGTYNQTRWVVIQTNSNQCVCNINIQLGSPTI